MEVHQAAGLKLGDLHERHPHPLTPRPFAEAGPGGEDADQLDAEAVPQRGGVPVPQHRAVVVVAVGVDRGAHFGVVGLVPLAALAWAVVVAPAVHRPERRGGQGSEDARVLGDLVGGRPCDRRPDRH